MLDVLFPVLGVLREGGAGLPVRLRATAREAAEKTIPMRALITNYWHSKFVCGRILP